MGLTPLEGLVMGTRSGDVDPALVLHLRRTRNLSTDEIDTVLNSRSGLLALAGDNDMREVHRRLDATTRIATVIAPPGYGKTTALRQWLDAPRGPALPTAFIPVGRIDDGARSFWRHLVAQLDTVLPGIDPELLTLLADPAHDEDVLGALVSWIERADVQANVILDDLPSIGNRSVLDGLALIVERV